MMSWRLFARKDGRTNARAPSASRVWKNNLFSDSDAGGATIFAWEYSFNAEIGHFVIYSGVVRHHYQPYRDRAFDFDFIRIRDFARISLMFCWA